VQPTPRVSGVQALAVEMDVTLPGSSRRNDVDIARSVQNALMWMTYVPQNSVKVMVESGWITLTGEVGWEYQRNAARNGVRGIMGVTGVSDQITIKHMPSSDAVKPDIEAALKRRPTNDAQTISVEIAGTAGALRGRVHSWSERDLAATCAWGSAGAHSVADNITVAPY
jgi:osmotically-inducible protein OsmY